MKMPTGKQLVVRISIVVLIFALISFGKWVNYEIRPETKMLRDNIIDREVIEIIPGPGIAKGILQSVQYKPCMCLGFFKLELTLRNTSSKRSLTVAVNPDQLGTILVGSRIDSRMFLRDFCKMHADRGEVTRDLANDMVHNSADGHDSSKKGE